MALGVLAFGYIDNGESKPSIEAFKQAYISDKGQNALQEKLHCCTAQLYPAHLTKSTSRFWKLCVRHLL